MHIEILTNHCLTKKSVEQTFPFDEDTLVFKVAGKMFALISLSDPHSVNLKCDPSISVELRQEYEAVQPGFHMDKNHWNTVHFNQDLSDKEILKLVDHSYECVVKKLPKKLRETLI